MKCKKIGQMFVLIAGITMVSYGAIRGEAATVLAKAIKLCLECVGFGLEKEITIKKNSRNSWMDTGSCHAAHQYPHSKFI